MDLLERIRFGYLYKFRPIRAMDYECWYGRITFRPNIYQIFAENNAGYLRYIYG